MKTLKVNVTVMVRANPDDEDEVMQAVKDALAESIEDDTLRVEVDEDAEDEDF